MTPEGRVKAKITKLLKSYGERLWYDMPVPTGFGKSQLDYTVCVNERFLAIEAKAPGKNPTPRQELTMAAMRKAGAAVYVVRNDDDLIAVRDEIERCL